MCPEPSEYGAGDDNLLLCGPIPILKGMKERKEERRKEGSCLKLIYRIVNCVLLLGGFCALEV